jgi:hypothetical protein
MDLAEAASSHDWSPRQVRGRRIEGLTHEGEVEGEGDGIGEGQV